MTEGEKPTPQNTAEEDKEGGSIGAASQSTLSEEGQTSNEQGTTVLEKKETPAEEEQGKHAEEEQEKPAEEEKEKPAEEKIEDKKMEVDPCLETAASCEEKGTCETFHWL